VIKLRIAILCFLIVPTLLAQAPLPGTAAPDFRLTDAIGKSVALSDYKGKVVLLDFWATWCGGCKVEIPWYVEFYKRYRHRGLAVIGVSMDDEGMKVVKPFLSRKRIKYPVVIGTDRLAKQYGLTSMPMTLLIDRNGQIALSHTVVVDKDAFETHIRELLKQDEHPDSQRRQQLP